MFQEEQTDIMKKNAVHSLPSFLDVSWMQFPPDLFALIVVFVRAQ